MNKEDVYETIDSVPDNAKETHKYIYFKKSILKKLRMKTELQKKGFIVYSIEDHAMPYDMVISSQSIFYDE